MAATDFSSTLPPAADDGRLDTPAFHRNCGPIWAVLAPRLAGRSGDVLEIGSGTGQHIVEFARQSPTLTWWPSDVNEEHLRSIAAWRAAADLPNLREPVRIDLLADTPAPASLALPREFVAIFCANVIHISPWATALGLFRTAGERLLPDGRLFLYGPFKRDGAHTAPSNAAFDESLRRREPSWGVRDLSDVERAATAEGLRLGGIVEMPANNLTLIFERDSATAGLR